MTASDSGEKGFTTAEAKGKIVRKMNPVVWSKESIVSIQFIYDYISFES